MIFVPGHLPRGCGIGVVEAAARGTWWKLRRKAIR